MEGRRGGRGREEGRTFAHWSADIDIEGAAPF